MRKSFLGRLFVTTLCMMLLINVVATPFAMAATVKTHPCSFAYFYCHTLNVKAKWIAGKTSKVTITNESDDPMYVHVSDINGCTVNGRKINRQITTLYGKGDSVTLTVKTPFASNGSFYFKLTNAFGSDEIKYSLSYSGFESSIFAAFKKK